MFFWLKKLVFGVAPVTLLVIVLVASFRMVQSETVDSGDQPGALATPVATQSVVIEAKSTAGVQGLPSPPATDELPDEKHKVWQEINDAISGLNDLVGAEMFLDVSRLQKGQMEVRLDDELWSRVRYQTRVDLKTDISNLWHLYVTEYGHAGNSVVYFIDDGNGRVIDIFSRAK